MKSPSKDFTRYKCILRIIFQKSCEIKQPEKFPKSRKKYLPLYLFSHFKIMDKMELDFYRGEYSTEISIIVPGWPQKGHFQ